MKIILEGYEVSEYLSWKYGVGVASSMKIEMYDEGTGSLILPMEDGMYPQPVDKKAVLKVSFFDQFGNKTTAPIGISPSWSINNPTSAVLLAEPDGITARHETVAGELVVDRVSVSAGVFNTFIDIQFTPGAPASIGLEVTGLEPR
jgi:hypothetical protein